MKHFNTCCCLTSIRCGCFIFGIYTLVFYIGVVTGGSFFVHESDSPVLLIASLLMIILSISSVIASVLIIIGLCVESRHLILPWIVTVSLATVMDVIFSTLVYITKGNSIKSQGESHLKTIFLIDIIFVVFNIYGILCAISQYQQFKLGRGTAEFNKRHPPATVCRVLSKLMSKPFWSRSHSSKAGSASTSSSPSSPNGSHGDRESNHYDNDVDDDVEIGSSKRSESKCRLMLPRASLPTQRGSNDDNSSRNGSNCRSTTSISIGGDGNSSARSSVTIAFDDTLLIGVIPTADDQQVKGGRNLIKGQDRHQMRDYCGDKVER